MSRSLQTADRARLAQILCGVIFILAVMGCGRPAVTENPDASGTQTDPAKPVAVAEVDTIHPESVAPRLPETIESAADPTNPQSNPEPQPPKPETPASPEPQITPQPNPPANPDDPAELAENPFPHRLSIPEFPDDMEWLNTGGPLRKQDLKGKFVLLDFWTYCCINCMHILPELKKLERAYPNELVVIGVHSAKFETEKESKNIAEAILRYEIEHPVVNDSEHLIWNTYGVRSWPTVLLVDPEGHAIWGRPGEIQFDDVDRVLKVAVPYYRKQGTLDETPIHFDLLAHRQEKTPLRFPGKVMADEKGNRLFIADSNHNRIVITSLGGELIDTIGSGAIGRQDGDFRNATFDHPQGMALSGETLYVADTENHLLRKVDLTNKQVTTIAGTGIQSRNPWPGSENLTQFDPVPDRWVGKPRETALSSPWDLWVHGKSLYIAMAGPHQIWKMPLDESEIGPFAGNGREDIVDGPLLPQIPYEQGFSSFAQPSGLSSDGLSLFVADSEGSSIRAVPFDPRKEVRTVVGTADLPYNRLFEFGDIDGDRETARLQHALGVAYHSGKLYVTDTYNNKIKVVDAKTGAVQTLAGTGEPGFADQPPQFDEPAGITIAAGKLYIADTNNHQIRTVDIASGQVSTLAIAGLAPPSPPQPAKKPTFPGAKQVKLNPAAVKPADGKITLAVQLKLPEGWKINDLAPMGYFLEAEAETGPVDRTAVGKTTRLDKPATSFNITLPVTGAGQDVVKVSMNYYYCQDGGEGLCKVGSVVWTVPLKVDDAAIAESVVLNFAVPE
jgi:thiol-disulfide isomerase/thioredoxin